MSKIFLHEHPDFPELIYIVADDLKIEPVLVEKDYWIMHCLWGLKQQGFDFILKGGTSLSKGYGIIDRFSEDIDIYITPNAPFEVNVNPKSTKETAVASRKKYYDYLKDTIQIQGIVTVERDYEFDDVQYYRSGGIRLRYQKHMGNLEGVKDGILLEVGFSKVTPNRPLTISSWIYDKGIQNEDLKLVDNRAVDVRCYHPGYSLVEKIQTIIKLYRQEEEDGIKRKNRMRQYYDVYSLLASDEVNAFIGTEDYEKHKGAWIKGKDAEIPIQQNEAFLLTNEEMKQDLADRYAVTKELYYKGQVPFADIIERIQLNLARL